MVLNYGGRGERYSGNVLEAANSSSSPVCYCVARRRGDPAFNRIVLYEYARGNVNLTVFSPAVLVSVKTPRPLTVGGQKLQCWAPSIASCYQQIESVVRGVEDAPIAYIRDGGRD